MRLRQIGGANRSQAERAGAMHRFREHAGPVTPGGWKHQCRCGNTNGRRYRGRYWCPVCGTEKRPLGEFQRACDCELCRAMAGMKILVT